jgi:hypothetical protein
MDILVLTETDAYVAVSDSSQASDVGSIPIARSMIHAKFLLIRLPLLTSHPPICAQIGGVCSHFAPKFETWSEMIVEPAEGAI